MQDPVAEMAKFVQGGSFAGGDATEERIESPEPSAKEAADGEGDKTEDGKAEEDTAEDDAPDEEEDVGDSGVVAAEDEKPKPKPKQTAQQRINEERRRRGDADRRAEAAEARIAELEKGLTKPSDESKAEPATTGAAPDPTKYDYGEVDPKYLRDLAKHEVRTELAAQKAEEEKTRQAEAAARTVRTIKAKADAFVEAGAEKYPDDFMDKVVDSPIIQKELTKPVHDLLLESEHGVDIARYLALHPKEAREIFSKSEYAQAAHFGRIEARFVAEAEKPDEKPKPKISAAPDPGTRARGTGGKFAPAPDTTNFREFERMASKFAR
jgi:hypothetical protein